ncbi:hypothetical protein E3N88_32496 [Mikania micrantha]|uniref:Uncharacterized protein n=1 Tax=Mikania micrantha TaxID=192012 RepID=A0A5N6M975_9ASTR|nr:hypothetical protein E3N88_32496 [Mikania micrantha]
MRSRVSVEDCAAAALDLGFLDSRRRRHSRIRVPANPSRRVCCYNRCYSRLGFRGCLIGEDYSRRCCVFGFDRSGSVWALLGFDIAVNIQHSGEDLSAGDHQDEIKMFDDCGSRLIGLSRNLDVVQTMDKTWRKWNQLLGDMGLRITGRNGPTSE